MTKSATTDATTANSEVKNATNDTSRVVSISEAALLLGLSVRSIQRRLDGGALEAVTIDGKRRVRLPPDTPKSAIQSDGGAPTVQSDTSRDASVAQISDRLSPLAAQLIESQASEIGFLRSQIEAQHAQIEAQRAEYLATIEAERRESALTIAALREAIKAMPRQLTSGDASAAELPPQRDEEPATATTSPAAPIAPESAPEPPIEAVPTVEPNKVSPAVYGAQAAQIAPEFRPTIEELEAEAPPARVPPQAPPETPQPWYPPKEQGSVWHRFKVWLIGG